MQLQAVTGRRQGLPPLPGFVPYRASGSLASSSVGGYIWPVIWRRPVDNPAMAKVLDSQIVHSIVRAVGAGTDTQHWAVTFYHCDSGSPTPQPQDWKAWFTIEHLGARAHLTKKDCAYRRGRPLPTAAETPFTYHYFSELRGDMDAFSHKWCCHPCLSR